MSGIWFLSLIWLGQRGGISVTVGSSEHGERSVYLGKLIDWERKEEKWWKGQKDEGWEAIDHVTAPAITSDMLLCFYCTVVANCFL